MKPRIIHVVGARPQFVKAAVICRRLVGMGGNAPFEAELLHTGQHYDRMLSDAFFNDLGIPEPSYNLGIGSLPGVEQTARIMSATGEVFEREKPDAVMVYGDTNSTLGAALAALKLTIPVVHLEAGVRIFLRDSHPEETNRAITDHCSALCLACTRRDFFNLRREGIAPQRLKLVGDPMYELFLWALNRLGQYSLSDPQLAELKPEQFHLATIHRAENTSTPAMVIETFEALDNAALPVVLPVHPRVRDLLAGTDWKPKRSLILKEPIGYFDMLQLLVNCKRVATDSGGVTREAYFAGKPSVVPRSKILWPEIHEAGWTTNAVDTASLTTLVDTFEPPNDQPVGLFGDGGTSKHVIDAIADFLDGGQRDGPWHVHGYAEDLPEPGPSEMTYGNFRVLVGNMQDAGYTFAAFPDAPALLLSGDPFVLMRHDIDMSLDLALRLAKVEGELGISATYFFMLRTLHYNVFSAEGSAAIREILALGHRLGLHFDCASYPPDISVDDLAAACDKEAAVLSGWFDREVEFVSYHRPAPQVLSGDPALSGRLSHTYMDLFQRQIRYISDSKGGWHFGHPLACKEFALRKPLHILIHPVWWNERPISPYETLQRYVQRTFDNYEDSLARNCRVYPAKPGADDEPEWMQ